MYYRWRIKAKNIFNKHLKLFLFYVVFLCIPFFFFPENTKTTEIILDKIIAVPKNISGDWDNLQAMVNRDLEATADSSVFDNQNSAQPMFSAIIPSDETVQVISEPVNFFDKTSDTTSIDSVDSSTIASSTASGQISSPPEPILDSGSEIFVPVDILPLSDVQTQNSSNFIPNQVQSFFNPVSPDPGSHDINTEIFKSEKASFIDKIVIRFTRLFSFSVANAKNDDIGEKTVDDVQNINDVVGNSQSVKVGEIVIENNVVSEPEKEKKMPSNLEKKEDDEKDDVLKTEEVTTTTIMTTATTTNTSTVTTVIVDSLEVVSDSFEKGIPIDTIKSFIIKGFSLQAQIQKMGSDNILKESNLVLSLAGWPADGRHLSFEYWKNNEWKRLHTVKMNIEKSNNTNGGYYLIPLDFINNVGDLDTAQIQVTYKGPIFIQENPVFLDAIWIEAQAVSQIPMASSTVKISELSNKSDFESDENVAMIFHYDQADQKTQSNILEKVSELITGNSQEFIDITKNTAIIVKDEKGTVVDTIEPKITYMSDDNFVVNIEKKQSSLKPGKYTLMISIYGENSVLNYQKDFTWGVLAINTNRALYYPGELVYLQMASLDASGHTLCNSNLELIITDPSGIKSTQSISKSEECGPKTVTTRPDYFSYYITVMSGNYTIDLKNLDTGYQISDYFQVSTKIPFIIERVGPTRIYPLAEYGFMISIKPQEDFEGVITETVPKGFVVKSVSITGIVSGNAVTTTEYSHTIDISAQVKWEKGEEQLFSYIFDAPDVSPELFLLGPLILDANAHSTNSTTKKMSGSYSEMRRWYIASDDFAIIHPNGDGTIGCTATPSSSYNYSVVADGTTQPTSPNINNYAVCSLGVADSYDFETATNVGSVSQIQLWVYYQSNTANDNLDVELWNGAEDVQYGSTGQYSSQLSTGWASTTFSGLNLTQNQLDNLKIKYKSTGTGGTGTSIYATYAVLTFSPANPAPQISDAYLNNGSDINLSANTTTPIVATAVITDSAGYADIQNVTAKIFRSGVVNTEACTPSDNDCYVDSNCSLSNCSGNTCQATCTVNMQFLADPTDASSPWSGQYWRAWIQATDALSQTGSAYSTANTPEVLGLSGISLRGANIDFGPLSPGQATTLLTASTSIISIGNTSLDIALFGTDLINAQYPSSTINVSQLRFANVSNMAYVSSTPLSYSPGAELELDIPKPTSVFSDTSSTIWWGLEVPIPCRPGSYAGSITYTSIINELPWP